MEVFNIIFQKLVSRYGVAVVKHKVTHIENRAESSVKVLQKVKAVFGGLSVDPCLVFVTELYTKALCRIQQSAKLVKDFFAAFFAGFSFVQIKAEHTDLIGSEDIGGVVNSLCLFKVLLKIVGKIDLSEGRAYGTDLNAAIVQLLSKKALSEVWIL